MDIILDANAYRQDFRMRGTQFQELFTYLRRTNCSLVVPGVVLLEAKSNYREFLSSTLLQLVQGWGSLRKFAISEIDELEAPVDIDIEVHLYGKRLMDPAPNVRVRLYNDYSGVDLEEVVRRGAERVRPANKNGEELRDVILWFIVVKYASEARCPVAFICADGDFQGPQGSLHETLASDLARAKAEVTLYRSISDFITANALQTEPMTEESFSQLIDAGLLRVEIQTSIEQSPQLAGEVLESRINAVHFLSGNKYTVGDGSFYLECRLNGEGSVRVREYEYTMQVPAYSPVHTSTANPVVFTPAENSFVYNPAVSSVVYTPAANSLVYTSTYAPSTSVIYSTSVPTSASGGMYNRLWSGTFAQPISSVKSYKCRFECEISARIDAGQLKALQTDRLLFTERELVSDSKTSQ
jgi:hypothetical protein